MAARWNFDECTCQWNAYSAKCYRPQHVVFALRGIPDPRLPLVMSSPVEDYIPTWVLEEAS